MKRTIIAILILLAAIYLVGSKRVLNQVEHQAVRESTHKLVDPLLYKHHRQ